MEFLIILIGFAIAAGVLGVTTMVACVAAMLAVNPNEKEIEDEDQVRWLQAYRKERA